MVDFNVLFFLFKRKTAYELRISDWSSYLCSSDLDPYVHAVGRIMCYSKKGDGGANMHRAILTPRYLRRCFERAGLVEIETVAEPRGDLKHRMVNMGLRGRKC